MTNKLDERGLTFSPNKTVSMIFGIRSKRNEEPVEIMLRIKIIPYKESTRSLGITLDNRLSWEKQIESQSKESIKYYKGSNK